MYLITRLFTTILMIFLLTSCASLGFNNQCQVIYEQNLELSKPPVVPTTTTNTLNN